MLMRVIRSLYNVTYTTLLHVALEMIVLIKCLFCWSQMYLSFVFSYVIQIDRGDGKIVTWTFKGQLMGFEWKYIGVCVDKSTGETTTAIKQSKGGAIEHSMRDLFQRLAARNAL